MGLNGLNLPNENLRLSPWRTSETPKTSTGREILRDFLQALPSLPEPAPACLASQLAELNKEPSENFLLQGLLQVGVRLKGEQRLEAAHLLLGRLSQADLPAEFKTQASAESGALLGQGSSALRAEFLLSRFAKDATDARLIAPMIGGTVVGQMAGAAVLGRLSGTAARGSSSWLAPSLAARLEAGAVGYMAEVAGFAGLSRALSVNPSGTFSDDLARAALTVGALRLSGLAAHSAGARFLPPARASSAATKTLLTQSSAFLGLAASHKLEERFSLRPRVAGETFFLDTLSSLVGLSVGGHLGRRVLGPGFARFQGELNYRSQQEGKRNHETPIFPELLSLTAGIQTAAGSGPRSPSAPVMLMAAMGPGDGSGKKGSAADHETRYGPLEPPAPDKPRLVAPSPLPSVVVDVALQNLDPFIGKVFADRYKVERLLGRGGLGMVYQGTHTTLDKKVAIKMMLPEFTSTPEKQKENEKMIERFLREAKITSKIKNPHIIDITDYGQLPDSTPFFVMEFLDGVDIANLLQQKQKFSTYEIVHLGKQIAEGLSAAHEAGVVHRDLKPANVFVMKHGSEPTFVKILDFGIAKMPTDNNQNRLTVQGEINGTPVYISPEQAAGKTSLDHRADIYSLGIMLYEMATGQVPFDGPNYMTIITHHMYKKPAPPSVLVPDMDPGLEAIILKCLRKKPQERYQSMAEVMKDLGDLKAGLVPVAVESMKSPESIPPPETWLEGEGNDESVTQKRVSPTDLQRFRPRWPMFAAGGALAAGILGVAIFLSVKPGTTPVDSGVPPQPSGAPVTDSPIDFGPSVPTSAPANKEIEVSIEPNNAQVFQGGTKIGDSPFKIRLEEGQTMEVEIRSQGYTSQTVVLTAEEPNPVIRLKRDPKVRQIPSGNGKVKPPPSSPQPKPSGTGGVINPWK